MTQLRSSLQSVPTAALILSAVVLAIVRGPFARFFQAPADRPQFDDLCAVAKERGLSCSAHDVRTEDGYVDTIFRLANPRAAAGAARRPVFLMHGLMNDASVWLLQSHGLASFLADSGYDVWLGNSRGTRYALRHESLSSSDPAFWRFSWDEMARFDLPAQIEFVCNETGASAIPVVGHSQGSTIMFAGLNPLSGAGDKLRSHVSSFVALAPVANISYQTFFSKLLWTEPVWGYRAFVAMPAWARMLLASACDSVPGACSLLFQATLGWNPGAWEKGLAGKALETGVVPATTSVHNIVHWCQRANGYSFHMHDYGTEENLRRYGSENAPAYDLSKFPADLPTLLVNGGHDPMANQRDVRAILSRLPMRPELITMPNYAHLDFVFAARAYVDLYPRVRMFLENNAYSHA